MTYTIKVVNNFKDSGKSVEAMKNGLPISIDAPIYLQPGETLTINARFDNPQSPRPTYSVQYSDWLPKDFFKPNDVPYEGPSRSNGMWKYKIKELQKTGTPAWQVVIECPANSTKVECKVDTDSGSGNVTVGDDQ